MPSFDIDFFGEDFSKNIGVGLFSLAYHDVIWFAYSTKYMTKWPKQSHVFYYDGFLVPLFIGHKHDPDLNRGALVAVLQEPRYELQGNHLHLTLPFPNPEDISEGNY